MKYSLAICLGFCVLFTGGCVYEEIHSDPVAAVVTLSIDAAQQPQLAGDAVSLDDLENVLRARSQDKMLLVVLDIAPEVSSVVFQEVFRQVRDADVAGIHFSESEVVPSEEVLFYRPALSVR